jgi:hypothetical protein
MHFAAYRNQTVQGKATGESIAARWARHEEDVRALLAVALVNGVAIPAMSERQAAKVVNVSRHKIRLARLASVDDAALVKMGRLRLQDVRRMCAKTRPIDDAEIENFINRAEPVRVLAYLDTMTTPALSIAAE